MALDAGHGCLAEPKSAFAPDDHRPPRGARMTHCCSYVRQNVVGIVGHVPRSGERSYKAMNDLGSVGEENLTARLTRSLDNPICLQ
jgi:hypothetical protein